ncbi:PEP-CTERM-box response regulator transcription factor [Photobacterium sp. BZF1]|uniref:PEP-CTERM-box response regulator transcription factor n=1 Tax=Photobacterium sp. BZF1 TaxID=1904457 RepID=UPI00165353AA|nr:PEP-CTERM-box response regulator transcription factor [Photobacterium sp. BZF1]MBC7004726.1 PEP-CTERM-box response regulator transcription factor [Photobacterium sp. BZF1]
MDKLLVIEDDVGLQKQLKWSLSGYETVFAHDRNSAISSFRRFEPSVVTLDLGLPPDEANASEGLATLTELLSLNPNCKVIVITGNEDRKNALEAIKSGAFDYYHKPIDDDVLSIIIERAFFLSKLEHENLDTDNSHFEGSPIIGTCSKIQKVKSMISRVAPTEMTTLLLGESGTGKEVLAREIHNLSERNKEPFIAINCASIPENLLESELFGYEKGAFTGAQKTTLGKIECANGGTLFLDEIGDMPYGLQAKILRFLQEKSIERVGGRKEIPIDVKVVCATHQNLHEMVLEKSFREDLFYRISEIIIDIPPLRDREEDVLLLSRHFLKEYSEKMSKKMTGFTDDAMKSLLSHKWPGNIRELQNKIKSAVVMSDGILLNSNDLGIGQGNEIEHLPLNLREVRETAEKEAVVRALSLCDGNISSTAESLGVTRPTLYTLLEKFKIKKT